MIRPVPLGRGQPQQPAPAATASALAAAPQHAPDASASAAVPQQVLSACGCGEAGATAALPQHADGADTVSLVAPLADWIVWVVIPAPGVLMSFESVSGQACTLIRHLSS